MNTDIQKEKELIKNGIIMLTKHIVLLKEKINKKEKENMKFLSEVGVFVQNSVRKEN
jgi:hypothetical protein